VCEDCKQKHTNDMLEDVLVLITRTAEDVNTLLEETLPIQSPLSQLHQALDGLRTKLEGVLSETRRTLSEQEQDINEAMDCILSQATDVAKRRTLLQVVLDYCSENRQIIEKGTVSQETLESMRKHLVKSLKVVKSKPDLETAHSDTETLLTRIMQIRLWKEPNIVTQSDTSAKETIPLETFSSRTFRQSGFIDIYKHIRHPVATIYGPSRGTFADIHSVAISPLNGDIAVSDRGRHVVSLFDNNGKFKKNLGEYGANVGQFNSPCGLDYAADGGLIVADSLNHRIHIWDDHGNCKRVFSHRGNASHQVNSPTDVCAFTKENCIYVCDAGNNRIQRFSHVGGGTTHNQLTRQIFKKPRRIRYHFSGIFGVQHAGGYSCYNAQNNYQSCHYKFMEYMSSTTPVVSSEQGHILMNDAEGIIDISHRDDDEVLFSFPSAEAICARKEIRDMATRNGRVVVAGPDFVEIY
jgi:hypothetical protein